MDKPFLLLALGITATLTGCHTSSFSTPYYTATVPHSPHPARSITTTQNPPTATDITRLPKRSSVHVAKHSPSSGRHSSRYDLPVERHAPVTSLHPGDDLPHIHNLPRPDSTSEATPFRIAPTNNQLTPAKDIFFSFSMETAN